MEVVNRAVRDKSKDGRMMLVVPDKKYGQPQFAVVFSNQKSNGKRGDKWTDDLAGFADFRRHPDADKPKTLIVKTFGILADSEQYITKILQQSEDSRRPLQIGDIVIAQGPDGYWALHVVTRKHYHESIYNKEEDIPADEELQDVTVKALYQPDPLKTVYTTAKPTEVKLMTIHYPSAFNRNGSLHYEGMTRPNLTIDSKKTKDKPACGMRDLKLGPRGIDVPTQAPMAAKEEKKRAKKEEKARKREVGNGRQAAEQKSRQRKEANEPNDGNLDTSDANEDSRTGDVRDRLDLERPSKRRKISGTPTHQGTKAKTLSSPPRSQSLAIGTSSGDDLPDTSSSNSPSSSTATPTSYKEAMSWLESHLADPETYRKLPLSDRLQDLHHLSNFLEDLAEWKAGEEEKFEKRRSELADVMERERISTETSDITVPDLWLTKYRMSNPDQFLLQPTACRHEQIKAWLKILVRFTSTMRTDLAKRMLEHNEKLEETEKKDFTTVLSDELVNALPSKLRSKVYSRATLGSAQMPFILGDDDDKVESTVKAPPSKSPWRCDNLEKKKREEYIESLKHK